ncbi:hypothetical protein [Nonomuraea maritima]|uniref:hypothetical protein n=1 Tax=Nonomuraea maritima TaxID=683260 RepID=UPI0037204A17
MDNAIRVTLDDGVDVIVEPPKPDSCSSSDLGRAATKSLIRAIKLWRLKSNFESEPLLNPAFELWAALAMARMERDHGPEIELEFAAVHDASADGWVVRRDSARAGEFRIVLVVHAMHSASASAPLTVSAEVAAQSMIEQNMDALLNPTRQPNEDLPIMVYVGGDADEAALSPIEEAIKGVLDSHELRIETSQGPFLGSIAKWFKAVGRGAQSLADSEIGHDLAAEAQRAIQLRAVDLEQAKVDDAKATAAAKLIEAAEPYSVVTIQAGSMLLLKAHDMLVVRDLTPREMLYVRRNSRLITDPKALLAGLDSCELPTSIDSCELPSTLAAQRRSELTMGFEDVE